MVANYSLIKSYKTCKRRYYFEHILKIKPIKKADALMVGESFHKKVDAIVSNNPIDDDGNILTDIMSNEIDSKYGDWLRQEVDKTEMRFENKDFNIMGIVDGIFKDGHILEYKTMGSAPDEKYMMRVQSFDEQSKIYCIGLETDTVEQIAIRKPTIRLRQSETEAEYFERCGKWYDETEDAIRKFKFTYERDELEQFKSELSRIIEEIEASNECASKGDLEHFYRNPYACSGYFKCPFEVPCPMYNGGAFEYVNFEKK